MSRLVFIAGLALSGCHGVPHKAPPRATNGITVPAQTSVIEVPVSANLAQLASALEDAVPRQLWTIDKPDQTCIPSKKIKVLFARIKTPTIKCRIVGVVTRGRMTLSGAGQDIVVNMPLHATVSARDIGGILKRETAHADARAHAVVRLKVQPDWSPRGTISIDYDWIDAPHIDFLGQRIEFTSAADAKLKGVIARLQRTLPGELEKLHLREQVAGLWTSAFTSLELIKANPSVWLRVTPQALTYGGYAVAGGTVTLSIGMKAVTETVVGPRPADPPSTPLPNFTASKGGLGKVLFAIPVIADYAELQPVLARALAKRSRRPFDVPGVGPVNATFGKVTIYGTDGGKIAVGLQFTAATAGGSPSSGTVWLTAKPINQVNSRRVAFGDLIVAGVTDSVRTNLLIRLANTPGLSATLADALTQNFSKDYESLLGKVANAIEEKRTGGLLIRSHIADVRTGQLIASGQGVYLPVWGRGTASIRLDHDTGR